MSIYFISPSWIISFIAIYIIDFTKYKFWNVNLRFNCDRHLDKNQWHKFLIVMSIFISYCYRMNFAEQSSSRHLTLNLAWDGTCRLSLTDGYKQKSKNSHYFTLIEIPIHISIWYVTRGLLYELYLSSSLWSSMFGLLDLH